MGLTRGGHLHKDNLKFGFDTGYPAYSIGHKTLSNQGEPTQNYATTDLGSWTVETGASRLSTSEIYKKQPVYKVRSKVGQVWVALNEVISGLRTAAGSSGKITFSINVRNPNASAYNLSTYLGHDWGSNSYGSNTRSIAAYSDWQRLQWTVDQSSMNNDYIEFRPYTNNADIYLDFTMPQVEINKGHATPFVSGTRNNTTSIVDLTNTVDIDVTDASFDSNSHIDLDGTGDHFHTSTSCGITGDITLEAVFNEDGATAPHTTVICTDTDYQYGAKLMSYKNSNRYALWLGFGSSNYLAAVDTTLNNNTMYHLVSSWDQSTGVVKFYLNGVLTSTQSTSQTSALSLNTGKITIGADYHGLSNSYALNGKVYVGRIYDSVLTDDQVKANFNILKKRFSF